MEMNLIAGFSAIAVAGGALCAVIFLIRSNDQRRADVMRQTYELFFPSTMGKDQVLAFIRSLSGLPRPKFLSPIYAISFEHYADERGERYFLFIPGKLSARLDEIFYQFVDGNLEPVKPEDDPVARITWQAANEYTMTRGGLT